MWWFVYEASQCRQTHLNKHTILKEPGFLLCMTFEVLFCGKWLPIYIVIDTDSFCIVTDIWVLHNVLRLLNLHNMPLEVVKSYHKEEPNYRYYRYFLFIIGLSSLSMLLHHSVLWKVINLPLYILIDTPKFVS